MTADDYAQLQNLIFKYAHLLDTGRWNDLGELFSHADVYIAGKLASSHNGAKLTEMWKRYVLLYPNGTPRTHHIMSNVTIEPDGENQARSHSYVLVVQQSDTLPLQPIIAGDYLDRFIKVDDVWRFSERRIGNELFGDLSQHLIVSIEAPNDRLPQSWT
ncbi:SnoaL-like protein [Paraburkholderia sp. BL18I3N2]|uniref:nuclear transport factor 2 family protein n=1 Tax=Paraburkholderia sp. BL18I3N2 TaxID=1938799 RepID=UPI000D4BA7A9|nr:nuclear transport factor 2 family protein [Paraburkholderia sp. BL18I3N2]PRX27322.1 SnoaL-like protein [Paraburkholderia sp. BL18I3N2]